MILKRFIATALIFILLASAAVPCALALVAQSDDYYVTDDAGVLTEATKFDIIDANLDLEKKCDGAQILIVTIKYLGGIPSDEYATRLFNDWGVGTRDTNNSMLLLLATEEAKGWLVVGAGLSGAFTNRMADDYLDRYFWPDVDAGRFDTAVRNICEALFSWYADYYNVNQDRYDSAPAPDSGYRSEPAQPTIGRNNPVRASDNGSAPVRFTFPSIISRIVLVFLFFPIIIIIIIASNIGRRRHRAYYMHMGAPIPRYHWWYMWGSRRPYRVWYRNNRRGPPRGPRGGPGGFGGPGGPRGPGAPPRGPGNSGRPGGGFGGSSGGGRPGGGFGGFGGSSGGGRSGGGFGGFGGGGRSGGGFGGGGGRGGGGFSGGGGGRR